MQFQCNATCGSGYRKRDILCVWKHGGTSAGDNCRQRKRPIDSMKCHNQLSCQESTMEKGLLLIIFQLKLIKMNFRKLVIKTFQSSNIKVFIKFFQFHSVGGGLYTGTVLFRLFHLNSKRPNMEVLTTLLVILTIVQVRLFFLSLTKLVNNFHYFTFTEGLKCIKHLLKFNT